MLADDLDLVVHVGDYIYEGSWGPQLRRHESPRGAETLADYRNRHACYKSDADLQRAHAAYPWLVTWDDHEVSNDYAGLVSAYDEAPDRFAARRAAAYRAYCEHMHVAQWTGVPSGAGGAEFGLAAALAPWISASALAPVLLVWRAATLHLALLAGGIALAWRLRDGTAPLQLEPVGESP